MTFEMPLVSVLMTAYNRQNYISEAVESVLSSTYKNFELIIVDDCSSDNTAAIAKDFEKKDNRVMVYVNEKNLGDYANRNKAASFAKGKYLKYLDSDDYMYPHSLEIMVEYMQAHADVALAFCDHVIQDDATIYPIKYFPDEAYKIHFLKGGLFHAGPGGTILSREKFDEEGGFAETRFLSDTDLIMRLALKHPILKIQPALIWWRIHQHQEMEFEKKNHQVLGARYNLSVKYLNKSNLSPDEKKAALHILKKMLTRNIFKLVFKKRISAARKVYKNVGLNFQDFLIAFNFSGKLKRKLKLRQ